MYHVIFISVHQKSSQNEGILTVFSSAIVVPPVHGLTPCAQLPDTTLDNAGYDSFSSISTSSSSTDPATDQKQASICGVTYGRLYHALKIKKVFIPAKLTYVTLFSGRAIFATYFIIFLTTAGLDPKQAGLIQGIRMIVLTLSGMFWGVLADRSKKELLIISIEICSFTALVFAKPWVAYWIGSWETEHEHRIHIQNAVHKILNSNQNNSLTLDDLIGQTNNEISEKFNLEWFPSHYRTGSMPLFVSMMGLGIATAFLGGGVQSLLDIKTINVVNRFSKNKNTYGRQRLWGSLGYAIAPFICGLILESVPVNKVSPIMPIFYIHLGVNTLAWLSCILLFRQKVLEKESKDDQNHCKVKEDGITKLLGKIFKNIHMLVFLQNVCLVGIGNGLEWCFMFIFLEEMNASKTIIGLCVTSQCFTEALVFPFASKINNWIGNNKIAVAIGVFGYMLAFAILQAVKKPIFVIALTSVLGVTFTLFYTASMDELYKAGNAKCMTTLFALYNSVLIGIGNGFAGIIGGVIYKNYGGRTLYFISTIFFAIAFAMNTIYIIYIQIARSSLKKQQNKGSMYKKFLDKSPPDSTNDLLPTDRVEFCNSINPARISIVLAENYA